MSHEEGLLVERPSPPSRQEREGHSISGIREPASELESTMTEMLLQSDGSSTAVSLTKWMFSVANRESNKNEFLFDSGAATSLCQQCFSDSLGGKPCGAGVDLRSATGPRFTTTGSTQIFMRTRRGVNVSGDFQIGPRRPACRDHSYQLDRWLTEATAWCFAGQVEHSSTK